MYGLFEPLVYSIYAVIAIACTAFVYRKCEPRRSKIIATALVAALFLALPVKSAWEDYVRESYFAEVCKSEAGEFIYKIVKDVEGVYEMKSDYPTDHKLPHVLVQPPEGKYKFREVDNPSAQNSVFPYLRYVRDQRGIIENGKEKMFSYIAQEANGLWGTRKVPDIVVTEKVKKLDSKYGYTWRNVSTNRDRELNIGRVEEVVVELGTGQVIGLQRLVTKMSPREILEKPWQTSTTCPYSQKNTFIYRVLVPSE